jgi:CBS domain containing-hemolysin-like protein
LSACQLGITLASLGLGWIGEPAFAHLLEGPLRSVGVDDPETVRAIAFSSAFALISFLHIVIGELAPKSLALRRPELLSLATALPLYLFYWLMFPAIWVLNASANWMLRRAGLEGSVADAQYSHEELLTILHSSRAAQQPGPQNEVSLLMAHTIELAELKVADLMRSRWEMVTLSTAQSHPEVQQVIRTNRFSRYPLFEAGPDKVAGIVHVKDVLLEPAGDDLPGRLRTLARPAEWSQEAEPALDLLKRFRQGTSHFALVNDEVGSLSGFITLEDILETIFGEILDEHEKVRATRVDRGPVKLKDGSLIVRGETPIFLLERALGREIPEAAEIATVSGLMMRRLDHVPKVGDVARFEGFDIVVRRMDGPRLVTAKVTARTAPKELAGS